MPSKPTDLDAMNITIDEDGTATLSGINYQDLRMLLNSASLYRHENGFKAEPLVEGNYPELTHRNNLEAARWHLDARLLLDVLEIKIQHAIAPAYTTGDRCRKPRQKLPSGWLNPPANNCAKLAIFR